MDDSKIDYFIYNEGADITTKVTVQGDGHPALFDPWTGKLTPVKCEARAKGAEVELTIAHRDAVILVMIPSAAEAEKREYGAAVTITAFDVTVESWGPDPDAAIPTQSKKTTVAFGSQPVGCWDDLPASAEQLKQLGVDVMGNVSGRACYKASFILPRCSGGVLTVDTGDCMIVGGNVNGQPIPPLNQRKGSVDLEGLVHESENTIELIMAITLINRLRIAHPLFDGKGGMPAPPQSTGGDPDSKELIVGTLPDDDYELPGAPMDMPEPTGNEYHYGLLKASVTPYHVSGERNKY